MAKQLQVSNVQTNSPMDLIKFSLQRQNEQGQALVEVINYVETLSGDMQEKYEQTNLMLKEVRDSYTITYEEQKELQATVFSKSIALTKEYFEGQTHTKEEFSKQIGSFRRAIWKKLKELRDVPRYTSIKRVEYDDSLIFVKSLSMKDFLGI